MKIATLLYRLVLLIPLLWWAYQIFFGDLGAEPAKELNHNTGLIALIYLVFNLWIGIIWSFKKPWPAPLRFLFQGRRFLGVLTYVILIGHVFLYFVLEAFEAKAFTQIVTKTYLIFGMFAFLGMTLLTLTSNDFALRKMGGKKWKLFHRLVYAVALLVTVHIFLIEKADLILFAIITAPLWIAQIVRFARFRFSNRSAAQVSSTEKSRSLP